MKFPYSALVCLLALAACQQPVTDPDHPQAAERPVRLIPVITRATETSFENGDAVGLTITRASGTYASNAKLTFQSGEFRGDVVWYNEGGDEATLRAYYPYTAQEPATFTVQADQSQGVAASDFIAAVKENVLPTAQAIAMPFRHKLTRLKITVLNNSGSTLDAISFDGARLTATLGTDFSAVADPSASPARVKAFKADDNTFYAVLPPQKAALTAIVTAGGKEMSQKLVESDLSTGYQYNVNIVVNESGIKVVLSGEIENWNNGGDIPGNGDDPQEDGEYLDKGYIVYKGVQYPVVRLKDGRWWMARNLAYVPEGFTPSSSLNEVTAGVFFPLVINEGKTAAMFSTDAAVIAAKGYLYQAEAALGLKVGDLTSVEAAQALEGAQGICPAGWHLPKAQEIVALVGKSVGFTTNESAPYYENGNGSLTLLNADGFGMDAFGAVSIQDNTKTAGTFMGWATGYPDKLSSGMFCGSTYAGVTYNTKDDPTSGVKNLQFYGFMPMTNKASENEYTCNGTKVSYRIAAPVRCIRNAD